MKLRALFVIALAVPAVAQVQTTGPFVGTDFESFESSVGGFNPCVSPRVFNNKGDLCTPGFSGAHTTGSWSFQCQIFPQDGSRLYGASSGPSEFTFDTPVYKVGSWVGTNCGTAGGVVDLWDDQSNLLGSFPLTMPADCTWNWNGFEVVGGTIGIKRIRFTSNYSNGSYVMLDGAVIDENLPLDLYGAPDQLSLASGGSQVLTMDVGAGLASKSYQVIGSITGTTPGITYQGVNVPLNFDPYWNYTFLNPNTPLLNGSAGLLNSLGQATIVFTLPPASDPSLAGLTVDHAGIVLDIVGATITLVHATNAYAVNLVP